MFFYLFFSTFVSNFHSQMNTFVNVVPNAAELSSTCESPICIICSKTFRNSSSLRMHCIKRHKMVESSSDESILRKKPKCRSTVLRFYCPIKGCKYEFVDDVKKSNWFADRRLLKQHFDKVHKEKSLTCSVCGVRKFSLERDKRYHEKICSNASVLAHKRVFPNIVNNPPTINIQPTCVVVLCQPVYVTCLNVSSKHSNVIPTTISGNFSQAANYSTNCKLGSRKLLPKPNSTWRSFVDKVDACNQTDSKRPKKSTRVLKNVCTQWPDTQDSVVDTACVDIGQEEGGLMIPPRPPSSCSLHLYDDSACQTAAVQTLVAAVQSVVPQSDIFCQTNIPSMSDASVSACFSHSGPSFVGETFVREPNVAAVPMSFVPAFDDNSTWSNIETQTNLDDWGVDFDDVLRHMETQTVADEDALISTFLQNTETQTSFIDFLDFAFQSAGTQTQ